MGDGTVLLCVVYSGFNVNLTKPFDCFALHYLECHNIKMLNINYCCLFQGYGRPGTISYHHNLLLQRSNGYHASI